MPPATEAKMARGRERRGDQESPAVMRTPRKSPHPATSRRRDPGFSYGPTRRPRTREPQGRGRGGPATIRAPSPSTQRVRSSGRPARHSRMDVAMDRDRNEFRIRGLPVTQSTSVSSMGTIRPARSITCVSSPSKEVAAPSPRIPRQIRVPQGGSHKLHHPKALRTEPSWSHRRLPWSQRHHPHR